MGLDIGKKIQEGGIILGGLGVIGFLGIIWLMIYGNLSGNLGFGQDTLSFVNQTITLNDAGAIPSSADNRVNSNISASSVIMTNATGGETLNSGNYTLSLVTFTVLGTQYNSSSVNVSYSVTFDEAGKVNTDGVLSNVTEGFTTYFGFSQTWFTIAAIVLLIFMLLGLLALAVTIMKIQQGGDKGFSG